jgi:hypothetical protein
VPRRSPGCDQAPQLPVAVLVRVRHARRC